MGICVCAHVYRQECVVAYACMYVQMPVEAWGWCLVSFLTALLLIFCYKMSHLVGSARLAGSSPENSLHFHRTGIISTHQYSQLLSQRFSESKLRHVCFSSQHFTHWAIFPVWETTQYLWIIPSMIVVVSDFLTIVNPVEIWFLLKCIFIDLINFGLY